MAGSKNQSPAQREKSQKSSSDKKDGKKKKDKKSDGGGTGRAEISVIVSEDLASKYLKDAKGERTCYMTKLGVWKQIIKKISTFLSV